MYPSHYCNYNNKAPIKIKVSNAYSLLYKLKIIVLPIFQKVIFRLDQSSTRSNIPYSNGKASVT
jgi:hypothetical protein